MGKNNKKTITTQNPNFNSSSSHQNQNQNQNQQQLDILSTLDDFTSKENWDKFFTLRGSGDSFEWYAEWTHLKPPLLSLLAGDSPEKLKILVPGCGNSRLSEHLYDAGFHDITNVDFSKVVISDMLRRNVRDRPSMRWRVMDITDMQFSDASFDIILDKGGLDALMEPEFGSKLGNQYLSEVKRVLKPGGKFICLTLAESHVLGLLFPKFRFGWEITLDCIPQKPSSKPSLNTFMVVAVKEDSCSVGQIVSSFDHSLICNSEQARGLSTALEAENEIRRGCVNDSDIVYSLEDLKLGAKGDLKELIPGRRALVTLGGEGDSFFRYRAVVLDAKEQSLPFTYHCGIFLVPKTRAQEWLFFSEEGQWMVVESSKAARLIMILLDSSHANVSLEEIQKDLSPLVKSLEPEKLDSEAQIPFMMAGDGIKHRNVVHQVISKYTGPIIVEDVMYENVDGHLATISTSKEPLFRRLVFRRSEGLVQSEALLIGEPSQVHDGEIESKKPTSNLKSKKREKHKADQSAINDVSNSKKVDHSFLVSAYHTGIVAGFTLVQSYFESVTSRGGKVETVVIGLGAGLLPMFLHSCMDVLHVEVVELDPVVLTLAKEYFGFSEDEHLKVHIADGIQFLRNRVSSTPQTVADTDRHEKTIGNVESTLQNGTSVVQKLDIIIVDVDSSDSSSGISCPAPDFLEDNFFATVKNVLSDQGLFVINLVSRSPSMKKMVISRMKAVFSHLYSLQLEQDVNEVIFAVNSTTFVVDNISESFVELDKFLKFENPERSQGIVNTATKIKCLK
ncbi:hypothetical protein RND81_14G050800 [Saponaria officinalis]|uniref:Methyltransferase type 11 domain-containing protein n=1 Tax=Saponaria officinalis TaxID=3572 RepID=A0AAW1GSS6_SAPOF